MSNVCLEWLWFKTREWNILLWQTLHAESLLQRGCQFMLCDFIYKHSSRNRHWVERVLTNMLKQPCFETDDFEFSGCLFQTQELKSRVPFYFLVICVVLLSIHWPHKLYQITPFVTQSNQGWRIKVEMDRKCVHYLQIINIGGFAVLVKPEEAIPPTATPLVFCVLTLHSWPELIEMLFWIAQIKV